MAAAHEAHHSAHGSHHGHHRAYDRDMHDADWQEIWERQRSREALEEGWLAALGLALGARLLYVGSGPGFISLLAARRVGPTGRVYALDRAPEALAFLRARLAEHQAANVEPVLGGGDAIPLPDASVSHALVAQMLHHNAAPEAILREVFRVLAPGGTILVVEHDPAGSTASGPPAAERLPAPRVRAWLAAAGYTEIESCPAGEGRYGFRARKPAPVASS